MTSRRKRLYKLVEELPIQLTRTGVCMGPYESQPCEVAEGILHEVSHFTLLGNHPRNTRSEAMWVNHLTWNRWCSDLWELRALSVQCAVGKLLNLPFYSRDLGYLFTRAAKTEAFTVDQDYATRLVERFSETVGCQRAALSILNYIKSA